MPFEIPENWAWARLGEIGDLYTGTSINESEKKAKYTGRNSGRYYIATKDVGFDSKIDYDNGVLIPKEIETFRVAPKHSILLCVEGGSAGRKIALTNQDVCFGNKLCCINVFSIAVQYVFNYLQSQPFFDFFKANTTGIIGGVSINKLKTLPIPIPPLSEQHRIVAKIEELFARLATLR